LLIALAITVVVYAVFVALLYAFGRRTAARELALLVPQLAGLFKRLLRDPRVPRGSKVVVAFGIVWVLSPIDLIPEFVPFLGPLDDAVVAVLVLRHLLKRAGDEVVREHWHGDPATLDKILRLSRGRGAGAPDGSAPPR
jgi:uncharacterized membrane protein YkvA (DUF1232 family)